MLSTTCIDFRSLRRLERSSPTSFTSFGSLFLNFFRVTFNIWRLLRGSLNYEDDAYGPPDSFISKSYDSCTECPSIKKVLSFSNIFCDVLVYRLAPALLAFPWGRILILSEFQQLVRIDHSDVRYIQVWGTILWFKQSFFSVLWFTLSVISFYCIYILFIKVNNLINTSIQDL